ncbi:tryptophan 2,3-dioxygenase family protein [Constantimarinum furrinae]|uniref:Tryptophan 2,3-dioxygenase n=1 Tax=Constantimarinum furrinae TaxID=2562285 RepID=A0A7G8PRZ7_9FLAO|nr:tryptophan 2,3-dioxygenase family protein [Constantimarinum furrinae]QNJ97113.1 Tryptophan 2,3-dioxygenase [Constantimarinum furrinae]
MTQEEIIAALNKKYEDLGENPNAYLKGLLEAKPINYWDYIEVDTLLSLQKPRTDFKDETIFIMYHQVTELVLKMMIHELQQLSESENTSEEVWINKLTRLNRYTQLLTTSFDIMKDGMNYDDYNTFRATLTPASGFQSAQFRYLEIYCTPVENLINDHGKKRLPVNPVLEDLFDVIYWKDAGYNRKTGRKTLTLRQFEEKYQDSFIKLAKNLKGKTIAERIEQLENPSKELLEKLKAFDHLYNVVWPMVHLKTAQHYLDSKGENKPATGGSEWKKYLHPKFQQRRFFPSIWSESEKQNWGENIL